MRVGPSGSVQAERAVVWLRTALSVAMSKLRTPSRLRDPPRTVLHAAQNVKYKVSPNELLSHALLNFHTSSIKLVL